MCEGEERPKLEQHQIVRLFEEEENRFSCRERVSRSTTPAHRQVRNINALIEIRNKYANFPKLELCKKFDDWDWFEAAFVELRTCMLSSIFLFSEFRNLMRFSKRKK